MLLNQLTIHQAQEGLKKKKFSSVELVKSCLEQIKKDNQRLNILLTVVGEDELLKQAEKADQQSQKFSSSSPLLGIPVVIKDIFCTKGIKTTAGAKILENFYPVYDATAVDKIKKAGAMIIGKANLDAWAHGSSGENSDFGPTQNPVKEGFVPGGSSSGSAAAMAAHFALSAAGTDTGGSIRLPAAFCGVVGLKPTYGRISRYGVIAMASSLDTVGCLTKDVTDAALMLKIMAGDDGYDATAPKIPVPDYPQLLTREMKKIKIGLPKEYFTAGLSKQIGEKIQEAVKKLEKLGFRIKEISLPHTRYALAVYYIIQPSEVSSNLARYDGIRYGLGRSFFGDEAKRRIMLGTHTLSSGYFDAYYLKAMKVRTLIKKDFEEAFKEVDVLLTPVSPTPPFKIGEKVNDPLKMYLSDIFTVTANLAGIPAISVPAGQADGLPVGLQILGPQFSEEKILQVAYQYEQYR
ncbi:Asp-tRNA(Asn)/Glu-tRNA(Gln) amidotransferase subunit GatA [Candidatus Shapirobacteria bacterium]|nr:Asp-tRNA(Asn)/Glu-tRNA(Gln) amidotransferase subunit GatA [Candidatus Shapirobacteria bacterium]